jgi:hypothetical protein
LPDGSQKIMRRATDIPSSSLAVEGRRRLLLPLLAALIVLSACARTDVYARLNDKNFTPDQAEIVAAVE